MTTRCYIDPADWSEREMRLAPDELHHLMHVRRVRVGDSVVAFDGRGREATAEVVARDGDTVTLRVVEISRRERPAFGIVLFQALLKGPRMDWLIEKATELGAAGIVPLETERGVVKLDGGDRDDRRERWVKLARSAAKQCGSAWVPEIEPIEGFVARLARGSGVDALLLCSLDADARPLREALAGMAERWPARVGVVVGPEGDFTAEEKAAARAAGAVPVSLGSLTLRAETAALFALSAIACDRAGR